MSTIDTATGLPELPEGHFWRISEVGGEKYTECVYLDIRRRWSRFHGLLRGSVEIDRCMVAQHEVYGPTLGHAVARRAQAMRDEFVKDKLIYLPEITALVGDYPPKKFGGKS